METNSWVMKKNNFYHPSLTFFFIIFLCAVGILTSREVSAGTKKIGEACNTGAAPSECIDGATCDDSFCTCGESSTPSASCAATYGNSSLDADKWTCIKEEYDPDQFRDEWNFCKKNDFSSSYPPQSTDEVRYPVAQKALLGFPCDDDDGCWDPSGTSGSCQQTTLASSQVPSDPYYDPWYTSGKKLKICGVVRLGGVVSAQLQCAHQYGSGSWTAADGGNELAGIRVCQKAGGVIMSTLAEMRKITGPAQNNTTGGGTQTDFFGIDVTLPEVKLVSPATKIRIPGVVFSSISKESNITTDESGAAWLNVPFLGEYISAIYKYSVGLISFIAVLVLIISGIQIITSAGNTEAISGAKHRIVSSVIAIALTAGSYTILYTINPELVNLRNLQILMAPGTNSPLVADQHDNEDGGYGLLTDQDLGTSPSNNTSAPSSPNTANMTGSIRYKAPKNSNASYLMDCSAFPNYQLRGKTQDPERIGARAREECRKACIQQLSEAEKSKLVDTSYNDKYLGYLDCSAQGTRSLASINTIAIHEGSPVGALPHWLGLIAVGQLPIGSHYFITRDGDIHQVMDEKFTIWHGVKNRTAIGIDLDAGCSSANSSRETSLSCNYTEAQYVSLNRLIDDIEGRIGDATILGHCDVGDPTNPKDHTDPRMFDWSRIGESNATHKRGKCLYVPGFELGSIPTTPPFGSKK